MSIEAVSVNGVDFNTTGTYASHTYIQSRYNRILIPFFNIYAIGGNDQAAIEAEILSGNYHTELARAFNGGDITYYDPETGNPTTFDLNGEAISDLKNGIIPPNEEATQYLNVEQARNLDLLIRSLVATGINVDLNNPPVTISPQQVVEWKNLVMNSIAIQDILANAIRADAHNLQALIELVYIKSGNDLLVSKLEDLEEALALTRDSLGVLEDFQNLHNVLEVREPINATYSTFKEYWDSVKGGRFEETVEGMAAAAEAYFLEVNPSMIISKTKPWKEKLDEANKIVADAEAEIKTQWQIFNDVIDPLRSQLQWKLGLYNDKIADKDEAGSYSNELGNGIWDNKSIQEAQTGNPDQDITDAIESFNFEIDLISPAFSTVKAALQDALNDFVDRPLAAYNAEIASANAILVEVNDTLTEYDLQPIAAFDAMTAPTMAIFSDWSLDPAFLYIQRPLSIGYYWVNPQIIQREYKLNWEVYVEGPPTTDSPIHQNRRAEWTNFITNLTTGAPAIGSRTNWDMQGIIIAAANDVPISDTTAATEGHYLWEELIPNILARMGKSTIPNVADTETMLLLDHFKKTLADHLSVRAQRPALGSSNPLTLPADQTRAIAESEQKQQIGIYTPRYDDLKTRLNDLIYGTGNDAGNIPNPLEGLSSFTQFYQKNSQGVRVATGRREDIVENSILGKLFKIQDDMALAKTQAGTSKSEFFLWLLDSYTTTEGVIDGSSRGEIQRNLTAGISAGQSLNDRQKEEVRRYLFVFEEYYKSAAAVLSKITQIIEKMAQGIAR